MSDNRMSDMIRASLENIKDLTGVETVIGNAITTTAGVTVIPVSSVSIGFANGGFDYGKRLGQQNFGGGGGTGISVKPIAFLTVGSDGRVELIKVDSENNTVDKAIDFINHAPEIIDKIKKTLS